MQKRIIKAFTVAAMVALGASTQASATDLSGKSWDEIEAMAKKEGKVTFSVWYLQPSWRKFVKEFEKEYGIKVKVPEGTIDGNTNKLMAEKGQKVGKMDVVAVGPVSVDMLVKSNAVSKLNFMPDFALRNHKLQGVDLGDYAVGYWGNQTGLAYDPMRVDESKLPQSWEDLTNYIKDNPNKFGYADPNGGGTGTAFIERALVYISGDHDYSTEQVEPSVLETWDKTWDWFNANKQNMIRTASNADSLTRLNDGEMDIVAAWEDHLFSLQSQGAITKRLKFYVPEFGMAGGGNAAVIAKNSPHPAASLLFLHWLTSDKTQKALHDTFGSRPLNNETGEKDVVFFNTPWEKAMKENFSKNVVSR